MSDESKRALLSLLAATIEGYGLPGLILLYGVYYLEHHVTQQQHERIVNMYFLGEGAQWFPAAVVAILATIIVLAQRRWYDKRLHEKDQEIRRIGDEKSHLQEQRIDAPLHHGDEDQRRSVVTPVKVAAEEKKKQKVGKTPNK